MITSRYLQPDDYSLLVTSLAADEYHLMAPMFFVEPETITLVYEDERGPVMFVRGKGVIEASGLKTLWLSVQYISNKDGRRNIRVMLEEFTKLVAKAKANEFSEIKFNSYASLLRKFCITRLGFFEDGEDTLRYIIC
jgi:hypothetical protein